MIVRSLVAIFAGIPAVLLINVLACAVEWMFLTLLIGWIVPIPLINALLALQLVGGVLFGGLNLVGYVVTGEA